MENLTVKSALIGEKNEDGTTEAKFVVEVGEGNTIESDREAGVTIGLIDAISAICEALSTRDMFDDNGHIQEAIKDIRSNDTMKMLMDIGELQAAKDYIEEQKKTIRLLCSSNDWKLKGAFLDGVQMKTNFPERFGGRKKDLMEAEHYIKSLVEKKPIEFLEAGQQKEKTEVEEIPQEVKVRFSNEGINHVDTTCFDDNIPRWENRLRDFRKGAEYGYSLAKEEGKAAIPDISKADELFIWDGIDGCLEEIKSMEDAEKYIRDNYMEDGEVHIDITSVLVLKKISSVSVEETGEVTTLNGEEVPIVSVNFTPTKQEEGKEISDMIVYRTVKAAMPTRPKDNDISAECILVVFNGNSTYKKISRYDFEYNLWDGIPNYHRVIEWLEPTTLKSLLNQKNKL